MVWVCWKDVYALLGEIQKTCLLAKTTVILLWTYIHLRTMAGHYNCLRRPGSRCTCWSYFIINFFCKGKTSIKNGGHFIQIGYFPTLSTNHSGSIICETSSPLSLLVWVAKTKLNSKKKFFIIAVDFWVLRKRDEKHRWTRHHEKNLE